MVLYWSVAFLMNVCWFPARRQWCPQAGKEREKCWQVESHVHDISCHFGGSCCPSPSHRLKWSYLSSSFFFVACTLTVALSMRLKTFFHRLRPKFNGFVPHQTWFDQCTHSLDITKCTFTSSTHAKSVLDRAAKSRLSRVLSRTDESNSPMKKSPIGNNRAWATQPTEAELSSEACA